MADPGGVYWISHTFQARSAPEISSFLAQTGVQPAWIDALTTIGPPDLQDAAGIDLKKECLITRWPEPSFSQHRILHSVLRSLLLSEFEMTLLLTRHAAVLLASHLAVGRRNLSPIAGFPVFSAFNLRNAPLLDQVEASVDARVQPEIAIHALLISGKNLKRPVKKGSAFEPAAWVSSIHPESGIADCCSVVDVLQTGKKKNGLAVEVETGGLVVYTALERM